MVRFEWSGRMVRPVALWTVWCGVVWLRPGEPCGVAPVRPGEPWHHSARAASARSFQLKPAHRPPNEAREARPPLSFIYAIAAITNHVCNVLITR